MTFSLWRPRIVGAKAIAEGELLPWWLGVAWMLPYSHQWYCLPIPLNQIVGAFRAWWLEWRRPCEDDPIATIYHYAHSVGFQQGNDHGYAQGLRHGMMAAAPRPQEDQ